MHKDLQDKLFKDFPELFAERSLSSAETRMCDGICVGDGWYNILYALCRSLKSSKEEVVFTQVKEKFGGLRIYTNVRSETADWLIRMAELLSSKTCCNCGAPGKLTVGGWARTLCPTCL